MPRQFTKAAEMRNYIIRFLYPLCVIEFDEILDLLHTNQANYLPALRDFELKHPERIDELADYISHLTRLTNFFKAFGQVPTVGMKIKLFGAPEMYTVCGVCLEETESGDIAVRVLLDK